MRRLTAYKKISELNEKQKPILDILEKQANTPTGLLPKITSKVTHISKHTNEPSEDILLKKIQKLGAKNWIASSSFHPSVNTTTLIEDSLYDMLPNIVDWMTDQNQSELRLTTFPIFADQESIGRGLRINNGVISEHDTTDITIYLKKTPQTKTLPFGFYIVTAYPDILTPNAKPTGEPAYEKLKNSPVLNKLSKQMQKRILNMATKPASAIQYPETSETSSKKMIPYIKTENIEPTKTMQDPEKEYQ